MKKQLTLKDALNKITCDEVIIINDKELSTPEWEALNEDMNITSFEVKDVTTATNEEITYIIIDAKDNNESKNKEVA